MYIFLVGWLTYFLYIFFKENLAGEPKQCFPTFVDGIPSKQVGDPDSNWAPAGTQLTKCPPTLTTTG
jgi:hypothetical protein